MSPTRDDDALRQFPFMAVAGAGMRWVEKDLGRYRDDGFGLWALCERASGRMVGDCGLTLQQIEERTTFVRESLRLDLFFTKRPRA